MQDSGQMNSDQMYQQALDQVQQEIDDMEAAEIRASQLGKGLGDYDLSAAAAVVRQERIAAEKIVEQAKAYQQQVSPMEQPSVQDGGQKVGTVGTPYQEEVSVKMTEEEKGAYETALNRMQETQALLTPQLLKKFPKMKERYEKAGVARPIERQEYFQDLPDEYLSEEEAIKALGGGKEGRAKYEQFRKDVGVVSSKLTKEHPEFYEVGGTKEVDPSEALKYGFRTALLTQYTGEPFKSIEETQDYIKRMAEIKGLQKK